ncbi:MAG: shikimate kinase, partial [Muribaculaceae bacterium]|nr:shikimate kinase [Muribaculaceae bacterium]
LEDYIEAREQRSIKAIFADSGEAVFRQLERDALAEVAAAGDVLIACGGGTPCFHGNMELMNSLGQTIWLQASRERLLCRLKEGRAKRPLIATMDDAELERYIDCMTEARKPYYGSAAATFGSDRLENEQEIRETVSRFVKQYMPEKI